MCASAIGSAESPALFVTWLLQNVSYYSKAAWNNGLCKKQPSMHESESSEWNPLDSNQMHQHLSLEEGEYTPVLGFSNEGLLTQHLLSQTSGE